MSNPDGSKVVKIGDVDATLRVLARVAVPAGLEDRVHARIAAEPRRARILTWPGSSEWMRSAAAAAIVFLVAGGGWSIYSRVQPASSAKAVVVSPHVGTSGSFSEGSAVRRPQTLQGPVVKNAVRIAKPTVPAKSLSNQAGSAALVTGEKKAAGVAAPIR